MTDFPLTAQPGTTKCNIYLDSIEITPWCSISLDTYRHGQTTTPEVVTTSKQHSRHAKYRGLGVVAAVSDFTLEPVGLNHETDDVTFTAPMHSSSFTSWGTGAFFELTV